MTLQEVAEKIIEAWEPIAERIEKLVEELKKIFEKIEEHKRLLRRPPKWYAKANNPAMLIDKNRVYHCRNNC
ncbi:MAG: hypothetical protein NC094_11955 [Bacteroidales bacterium]|nr:hypothetical protein [Lachnoclostridium sp.]MCM1385291.1 hypothetical protein [Lachnoclostridium sp.]MCM1466123.1 hypothetical protein [Bacteroidales bacterium]